MMCAKVTFHSDCGQEGESGDFGAELGCKLGGHQVKNSRNAVQILSWKAFFSFRRLRSTQSSGIFDEL